MSDHMKIIENKPQLSICIIGRDDDYMYDFKFRLSTTINYIARNLAKLGMTNQVEVLITDWGSKIPLSNSLTLIKEAREITNFIHVSEEVIRHVQEDVRKFHTSCATNVGLVRAKGDFILPFPADTLLPIHSLDAIFKLINGKLNISVNIFKTYFLIRRCHIPWQFVVKRPSLEDIDRFLLFNQNVADFVQQGAHSGAALAHQTLWKETRGFNEEIDGWGINDIEFLMRVSMNYSWVELSSLGVISVHMEHSPFDNRSDSNNQKKKMLKEKPHLLNPQKIAVNTQNWGLNTYDLVKEEGKNIDGLCESGLFEIENGLFPKNRTEIDILKEIETFSNYRRVKNVLTAFFRQYGLKKINKNETDTMLLLAWYCLHNIPDRYLEYGVTDGLSSATVTSICKDIEFYAINKWETRLHGEYMNNLIGLLNLIRHKGYYRLINGDANKAMERYFESLTVDIKFDLILVRGDILNNNLHERLTELISYLSIGGALIFTCKSKKQFDCLRGVIESHSSALVLYKCKHSETGLILNLATKSSNKRFIVENTKININKLICSSYLNATMLRSISKTLHKSKEIFSILRALS